MANTMQLETLRRIVQEVDASPSLHEALDVMVNQVAEAMKVDVCSIYLLDERNHRYVLMATHGLNAEAVGNVSLSTSEGLVGLVGQREEIVNLENAPQHDRFRYLPETGEEIYNSFMGVPVMYRRKVMGVMVIQNKESQDFSEAAESFLVTLCAQLSGAIAHAHVVGNIDVFRKPNSGPNYQTFLGVPGADGVALGRAVILYPAADLSSVPDREAEDISEELDILAEAVEAVRDELQQLDAKMQDSLMSEERALFGVFLRMLDDHALPYLRERVADLKDLGRRILAHLQTDDTDNKEITEDTILIGEEISTAALVEMPIANIAAIVTTEGAANSHMVIVARALGIPTVVGVTELPIHTLDDAEMIVDAYQGRVFIHPPRRLRTRYKEIKKDEDLIVKDLKQYETKDAIPPDGEEMKLFVNTGLMIDVVRGVQRGAKGVGLYRSEIPFMLRERFPGEEEQRAIYRQQLSHFANKPVVMRTLDIGADKDLPYFSIDEENSALGWRGIRFTLDHPEIFSSQIRAMLKAEEEQVKITRPKVGIMIEVPSILLQIEDFADLVDFFSVGSNDLIQYLLAVDRNNPRVASVYSHFHPAILRALAKLVQDCHKFEKPVSICGEMAGDPLTAILLMAMGFNTLSMSSSNILRVRKAICNIPMSDAKDLLDQALKLNNPLMTKSMIEQYFRTHGLGDMVKSGRVVTV